MVIFVQCYMIKTFDPFDSSDFGQANELFKMEQKMVPYSITIYFVTLVFIHLNVHCCEACNLNNLAIFFLLNQYKLNFTTESLII